MENNELQNKFAIKLNKSNRKILSRVPWSDFQEFKNCYDFLFSNNYGISGKKIEKVTDSLEFFIDSLDYSNLTKGFNILNIWNSRTDNNTYVLSTILLLEEIMKFINNSYLYLNINDMKHILSQKIIRVTNLIIDDLKKKNKNIAANMFLVAKGINLPEFIIEIRHICTHKNLPDLNTLNFAIKYLYFWTKINYWDKQYEIFSRERNATSKIIEILKELKKSKNIKKNSHLEEREFTLLKNSIGYIENQITDKSLIFRFEINSLFDIVSCLVECFCSFCVFSSKGKVLNERIKELNLLFELLFKIEGDLFILMIYKYIAEFIFYKIGIKIFDIESNNNFTLIHILNENRSILKKFKFLTYFLQKFPQNKVQISNIVNSEFELDDFDHFEKTKKNKKISLLKIENDKIDKLNLPFVLNYIYDMLKFSNDFSIEIKEIFDIFVINFKNFDLFNDKTNLMNNHNNFIIDENVLNFKDFLNKKKERNKIIHSKKCGSLIFEQLEMITQTNNEAFDEDNRDDCIDKDNNEEEYNFKFSVKKKKSSKDNKNGNKNEDENRLYLNSDCILFEINKQTL